MSFSRINLQIDVQFHHIKSGWTFSLANRFLFNQVRNWFVFLSWFLFNQVWNRFYLSLSQFLFNQIQNQFYLSLSWFLFNEVRNQFFVSLLNLVQSSSRSMLVSWSIMFKNGISLFVDSYSIKFKISITLIKSIQFHHFKSSWTCRSSSICDPSSSELISIWHQLFFELTCCSHINSKRGKCNTLKMVI